MRAAVWPALFKLNCSACPLALSNSLTNATSNLPVYPATVVPVLESLSATTISACPLHAHNYLCLSPTCAQLSLPVPYMRTHATKQYYHHSITEVTDEELQRVYATNIFSFFYLAQVGKLECKVAPLQAAHVWHVQQIALESTWWSSPQSMVD